MIPFIYVHAAISYDNDDSITINVNHIIAYSTGTAKDYSSNKQVHCCVISCVGDLQYNVKEDASQVEKLIKNSQKEEN
jgi:hypothetical protein